MFGNKYEELARECDRKLTDVRHNYALQIETLKHEHKLALQQKEFDLKHFKDDKVKKLNGEKVELQKKVAVLEQETMMLDKLVDVNADIIDVKELVKGLINKIPTIDLKSLTVNTK